MNAIDDLIRFLNSNEATMGRISNERGLQLELGYHLRVSGYGVEFEKFCNVTSLQMSTRKPKRNLDLLISKSGRRTAIELKVPLAGRVPETMYDFCADIEFVEAILRHDLADDGLCVLVSTNQQFWKGNQGGIYEYFRGNRVLTGAVPKPTGSRDSSIVLMGQYQLAQCWAELRNSHVLNNARYLLVEISKS